MTTDRELLEWAAKAAGIEVYESTDGTLQNRPVLVYAAVGAMGTMPYEERWNPLADDAQALRLAVKLRLCYGPNLEGDLAVVFGDDVPNLTEPYTPDPYAATRRAIVRAAASIGQQMEK